MGDGRHNLERKRQQGDNDLDLLPCASGVVCVQLGGPLGALGNILRHKARYTPILSPHFPLSSETNRRRLLLPRQKPHSASTLVHGGEADIGSDPVRRRIRQMIYDVSIMLHGSETDFSGQLFRIQSPNSVSIAPNGGKADFRGPLFRRQITHSGPTLRDGGDADCIGPLFRRQIPHSVPIPLHGGEAVFDGP